MERAIWYRPSPLTTTPIDPRKGTLSDEKRADQKLVIVDEESGQFFEVHGDGSYGWQGNDPNEAMTGATFAGLNFLEYPGHSDRGGVARPTFLVAFYDRD